MINVDGKPDDSDDGFKKPSKHLIVKNHNNVPKSVNNDNNAKSASNNVIKKNMSKGTKPKNVAIAKSENVNKSAHFLTVNKVLFY